MTSMDISDFGEVMKGEGIRAGSGVPCSYFKPLVNYMASDPGLRYIGASSEGEAVAIAAGMVAAGQNAFALMQNSGLGNAVNPITSLLYIYGMPVALLVSHRGQPGLPDEPQHERMGEITSQLVELCGMECSYLRPDAWKSELADMLKRQVPHAWVCQKGTLTGGPAAPPISFELRTSEITLPPKAVHHPELAREQALAAILPILNRDTDRPAVIATTGKLSRELYELDDQDHSRANRFYMVGSMGCASAFGLGIADAKADKKVVVLDGDGALLMKFGTLATAGAYQLKNFHHVVLDNGAHDSTGGQATASPVVDTAAVALSCGYRRADTVSTAEDFRATLDSHLEQDGPTLLRMMISTGARKDLGRPKLKPPAAYERFRDWVRA